MGRKAGPLGKETLAATKAQLSPFRGPHRKIETYLLTNGPRKRMEIREAFPTYGGASIARTLEVMMQRGMIREEEGKIILVLT